MAKARKKKRSQPRAAQSSQAGPRTPKSMVIRMGAGQIGASVTQLVNDFRAMMEPHTASRLKERRANRLKDYTAMAGPLGVTHFFLFSRSKTGNVHLRMVLTPRGPTLAFRVDNYVLAKDVMKSQRRPRGGNTHEYQNPPLLVMNNFTTPETRDTSGQTSDSSPDHIRKQLESLTTTIFQSMFPAISPSTTPLSSIRRIMLVNRERAESHSTTSSQEGQYVYTLRHYSITTRRTGVSRRLRKVDGHQQNLSSKPKTKTSLPNLGKLQDAADYLLQNDGGYTSASETELDTDNEIEVLQTPTTQILGKRQRERERQREEPNSASAHGDTTNPHRSSKPQLEKRAVKLVELGPRMKLHLIKVEEGLCEGRVMWNEYVSKSKEEEKELEERWKVKRQEKEERKRVQKENVERKRKEREERKGSKKENGDKGEGGEENESDEEEWDTDEAELALDDEELEPELGDADEMDVIDDEREDDEEANDDG